MTEMKQEFVKLTSVPKGYFDDLPLEDKESIMSCIGNIFTVDEIDQFNYWWIGFGFRKISGNRIFETPNFCVPKDCVERQNDDSVFIVSDDVVPIFSSIHDAISGKIDRHSTTLSPIKPIQVLGYFTQSFTYIFKVKNPNGLDYFISSGSYKLISSMEMLTK